MRRALWAAAGAVMLALSCTAPGWADVAGGGTQGWNATWRTGAPASSQAVAVAPDGSTVFVTGSTEFGPDGDSGTLAYDARTGEKRWADSYPAGPGRGSGHAITVSPNGKRVYVAGSVSCPTCSTGSDDAIFVNAYNAANGDLLWSKRYAALGGTGMSVVTSADGSELFVAGQVAGGLGSVTIAYDPADGRRLWAVEDGDRPAYGDALAVTPDGSTVLVTATGSGGGESCFSSGGFHTVAYDATTGDHRWSSLFTMDDPSFCGVATSLAMSPDGSRVFVSGYGGHRVGPYESGTVAYDVATGAQSWSVTDDAISVVGGDTNIPLAVTSDGSKVIETGTDCSAYPACPLSTVAYDTSTGERQWRTTYDAGGEGYAQGLTLSPNGSTAYVTGQWTSSCFAPCETAQIAAPVVAYDTATGAEEWATTYEDNVASDIATSPDGGSLYLAGTFTGSTSAARVALVGGKPAACSTTCGYSTTRFSTTAGPGRFEESSASVTYDHWRTVFAGTALGGAYRSSNVAGSTATITTPAVTALTWVSRKGPAQGRARVTIDGHRTRVVNLYASTPASRSIAFTGLTDRPHTVRITVLGRAAANSKGTAVALDALRFHKGTGVVQESSAAVRYDGWRARHDRPASGHAYRTTTSPSARVSFGFSGRSLTWVTATGSRYGRARVLIDGKAHPVALHAVGASRKATFTFGGLSRGKHRLTIRALGSGGLVVDAFVVRGR